MGARNGDCTGRMEAATFYGLARCCRRYRSNVASELTQRYVDRMACTYSLLIKQIYENFEIHRLLINF